MAFLVSLSLLFMLLAGCRAKGHAESSNKALDKCPGDSLSVIDTTLKTKTPNKLLIQSSGTLNLGISQQQVSDWLQGEHSFVDLNFDMRQNLIATNQLIRCSTATRVQLGLIREYDEFASIRDLHTTDNEFRIETMLSLLINWRINPFVSMRLSTPLTESFRAGLQQIERSASFWDPVTSDQSCGFHFIRSHGKGSVELKAGANTQQIRSRSNTSLSDDLLTPSVRERYKSNFSIEAGINALLKLDSNLLLSSQWQSRRTLQHNAVWSLRLDNELRVTIWKALALSILANLVYDESFDKRLQFKESTRLGLNFDY